MALVKTSSLRRPARAEDGATIDAPTAAPPKPSANKQAAPKTPPKRAQAPTESEPPRAARISVRRGSVQRQTAADRIGAATHELASGVAESASAAEELRR